jgi:hypothetical protein
VSELILGSQERFLVLLLNNIRWPREAAGGPSKITTRPSGPRTQIGVTEPRSRDLGSQKCNTDQTLADMGTTAITLTKLKRNIS